jgi:hypothetical protein
MYDKLPMGLTKMNTKRAYVVLEERLLKDIDRLFGARQRSIFLTAVAEEKLMRMRQIEALRQLVPWKNKDHPELKHGAAKWVSKLRHEDERRYKIVANP